MSKSQKKIPFHTYALTYKSLSLHYSKYLAKLVMKVWITVVVLIKTALQIFVQQQNFRTESKNLFWVSTLKLFFKSENWDFLFFQLIVRKWPFSNKFVVYLKVAL